MKGGAHLVNVGKWASGLLSGHCKAWIVGVHVKVERVYTEPGGQTGSENLLEVFLEDCGIYVIHFPVLQGKSIVWVFSFSPNGVFFFFL